MENRTRETTFSSFALGLIGLCFLLLFYESIITRQLWREIPRIVAGLISPLPLALLLAFWLGGKGEGKQRALPSPLVMTCFLAGAVLVTLLGGAILSGTVLVGHAPGLGAAIAQSALLTTSVLNLLFLRNGPTAAACSGGSIGLTVHVIFFS